MGRRAWARMAPSGRMKHRLLQAAVVGPPVGQACEDGPGVDGEVGEFVVVTWERFPRLCAEGPKPFQSRCSMLDGCWEGEGWAVPNCSQKLAMVWMDCSGEAVLGFPCWCTAVGIACGERLRQRLAAVFPRCQVGFCLGADGCGVRFAKCKYVLVWWQLLVPRPGCDTQVGSCGSLSLVFKEPTQEVAVPFLFVIFCSCNQRAGQDEDSFLWSVVGLAGGGLLMLLSFPNDCSAKPM